MSFVLSVGFAVEYSVHIVARFLRADSTYETGLERVKYTMSFLMMPTFMSFASSLIGVVCLAFTEFEFNYTFFFKPLIIVMFATYFYGCWWLPAMLTLVNWDIVKLGQNYAMDSADDPRTDIVQESVVATGVIESRAAVAAPESDESDDNGSQEFAEL